MDLFPFVIRERVQIDFVIIGVVPDGSWGV
jgi:hypothetical protein